MKTKITIAAVAFLMIISLSVMAQDKKKNTKQKVTYDVSMTCENCKKRIEKNIAYEKGVTDLVVNLPEKTVKVEFQDNKTDTLKLRKAIEKLGYNVSYHSETK